LMKRMGYKPEETVIMGDQFITDIWVANRVGCRSILVLPIVDPKIDNSIKLTKFLEKHIYKRISNNSFNELNFDNSGVLSDELQII
jgi:predicted HAD superfamily phosphohydrolase YqeG